MEGISLSPERKEELRKKREELLEKRDKKYRKARLLIGIKKKSKNKITCSFCGAKANFFAVKNDGKKVPCCNICVPVPRTIPWIVDTQKIL